jgi:hypothetical protein
MSLDLRLTGPIISLAGCGVKPPAHARRPHDRRARPPIAELLSVGKAIDGKDWLLQGQMVMDILLFDQMTGKESIPHAGRRVEECPETNMARCYELFVDLLRRLCAQASVQPNRSDGRREAG